MLDCVASTASEQGQKVNCDDAVKDAHRAFQQAASIREARKSDILRAAELAYAAHLSVEDMQAAAAFFESPAGRRLIAAGPAIAMEYETANRNIITGVAAGSEAVADRIYYVSGGLMSAHTELQIDLESGHYVLTEPKSGAFTPEGTYEGRLSIEHLAKIRNLAATVAKFGFKSPECLLAEQKESRRRKRIEARTHQIFMDLPPMDAQLTFWVRIGDQTQSAPLNEDCWTNDAKTFQNEMFAAARSDHE